MGKQPPHYYEMVYDVVRTVPNGRVTTYGAIADYLALGSARMVGYALRNMSYMDSDVPAHRVVNRIGELTGRHHFEVPGYMQECLEREGIVVENDRVKDFLSHFWHPAGNF